MSAAETEKVLERVAQVKPVVEGGRVRKRPTRFLKPSEVQNRNDELGSIEKQLNAPAWHLANTGATSERIANLRRRRESIRDEMEESAPPDVSGGTKDALAERAKVLEEKIRDGMLSHEEMRRNPVGAVGRHSRWEKANKHRILEYKNIVRLLEHDNDDPDVSNIERLRPHNLPAHGATYMMGAQIPGQFNYAGVPEENWKQTFGKVRNPNSPVETAKE